MVSFRRQFMSKYATEIWVEIRNYYYYDDELQSQEYVNVLPSALLSSSFSKHCSVKIAS
jgi:hypothetical protein